MDSTNITFRNQHDHRPDDAWAAKVWETVSHSPLRNLWDLEGLSLKDVFTRTGKSFLNDNLLSRAAELGYYFLFALFPTLISASSILGLAAQHASQIYVQLLNYLALIVPPSAYEMVIDTFKQTTAASTGGKVVLGIVAALWSASVGFSAIQDGMNTVYKVKETRPYWKARGSAMLVTLLLSLLVTLMLAVLLGADIGGKASLHHFSVHRWVGYLLFGLIHITTWVVTISLLILLFSTIYYFAPDLKAKRWHWLTPGSAIGILTWIVASIGLRVYLHYFNTYTVTYGSLGAVIILLTWFYVTGLTLLLGAEVNSEVQAAVVERLLREEMAPSPAEAVAKSSSDAA
ncbi:YihY/virulence factor BrkB family protein [Granulicella cerasi]|uniref:YihY/virulence factor BrkB family protein n=1 Tax=Granulicella cerasi TaxID=741063 RepID=A0ABW1ZC26_9BACT|nr:YihY/virulence factor BrkB family protein [Granulicella cerasi]